MTDSARDHSPDGLTGDAPVHGRTRRDVIAYIERFHWWHTTLGLFGNTCFVVGSVLFLRESTRVPATWLFIVGSLGMLLGSLGDAAAQVRDERERERGRRHREVSTAASDVSEDAQPRVRA